jgi:hypothetical protein
MATPQEMADALKALEGAGYTTRDLYREITEYTDVQIQNIQALAGNTKNVISALKRQLETREAIEKSLERQQLLLEGEIARMGKGEERAREKIRLNNVEIEQIKERGRRTGNIDDKRIKDLEEQNERLQKIRGTVEDIASTFGGLVKLEQKSTVNLGGMAQKAKSWVEVLSLGEVSMAKLGTMAAGAIAVTWLDNILNLAINLHDAEAAFMKTTGASKQFASSLSTVYENSRIAGVSIEEASASMSALYGAYTDFTMLAKSQREALSETGAVLAELGVKNQDFAMGVQVSTKMLGQSAGQAESTARELTTFAKALGVTPEKMAADFAAAGPELAKFGDMGVQAFKDLGHTAKITGMDVKRLLDITSKFDTFEGAAEQAGKLNAALGGNFVNAMDLMMETDPNERFRMLRDSILDTGLSFDDMSYYQKNFYKDAMGLQDVGELAMALSGDMDSLGGATEKSAAELIEMKKAAQGVQSMQEQFQILIASMTPVLTPLIDGLSKFFGWIADPENETALRVIGTLVTIASVAMAALAIATAGAALAASPLTIGIALVTGAIIGLVTWLFGTDVGHSNFLEGLWKIAGAFDLIAVAAAAMKGAVDLAKGGFHALTFGLFKDDVGASTALEGFEKLAKAEHKVAVSAKEMGEKSTTSTKAMSNATMKYTEEQKAFRTAGAPGQGQSASGAPIQHLTQEIKLFLTKDGRRAIGQAAAEFQGKEIQLVRS